MTEILNKPRIEEVEILVKRVSGIIEKHTIGKTEIIKKDDS